MRRLVLFSLTLAIIALTWIAAESDSDEVKPRQPDQAWRAFGPIQPRLSSDGKKLVFSYQGAIWTMPCQSVDPVIATRMTQGDGFDTEPVWSPDGTKIAYVNTPNMSAGPLKIIDSQNGEPIRLPKYVQVRGTAVYYKLEFHPDNKRILGVLRVAGTDHGLAWFHIETGEVQTLVKPPRWSRYALSKDGSAVVYTQTKNVIGQQGGNDGPQADLWLIDSTGGKPRKIGQFPCRIHDLCWAADNRGLFVVSELGGVHYDLWYVPMELNNQKLHADVANARKLTFGQADETRPSVSNDGQRLLFLDNRHGATELVLRDLTAGLDQSLSVSRFDFRQLTGRLSVEVVDASTKRPITGRVSIQNEHGKFHAPAGSLYRVLKNYGHFYCRESAELTVPVGKYQIRSYRGPEYRPVHMEVTVKAGQDLKLRIKLDRWIDNSSRGWYCGENHIHANYGYGEWYNSPATMLDQCAGEDLRVANFMVANSDTDGVFDREFFRGQADPLSTDETILYWNQEFRSTIWGHMTLINLKQVVEPVFTGFKDTTNPWDVPTNSDIAERTHWQNGLVNYTHVAQNPDDPYVNPYTGKGIPVDVALGNVDSLDLNASYQGTTVLWYRLLNCGFRLPASAGTDCFLNRIRSRLPGGDRVYVHVDQPFSYQKWIAGLRAGRSFVTNGPMLEFSAAGKQIGDTISLEQPAEIRLSATARSLFPMDRVEVLFNGQVIATGKLNGEKTKAVISTDVKVQKSGWLGLRAVGPGHADLPLGRQDAHTSPIYVEVAGKPAGSRKDAQAFLKWIDRLEIALRVRDRFPNEKLKRHVQSQLDAARRVYVEIAERSE